ncbi:MAG: hypothetical protein ACYTA3_11840 [Planctomycetota bacterium]
MNIPVYVCTADKYLWALKPFAYLFNIFWSSMQPVTILGYNTPDFALPPNFDFKSLGEDGGQDKWSDGIIRALRGIEDELLVLLLDDYWLTRTADNTGVATLADYVYQHPNVLRMDLTTDRLYTGGMFEVESYGHYDIVETPPGSSYQMSLQAGIWRRKLLLALLQPGMSPWAVELQTSPPENMRALGTRQNPVKYANVFQGGNPDNLLNLEQLPKEHVDYMRGQGWLE